MKNLQNQLWESMKPQFNNKIRWMMHDFEDLIEKPDIIIYGGVSDRILHNISRVVEMGIMKDLRDMNRVLYEKP
ncbi:MAG TPA: hypothetical protein PKI14_01435 [Fervidobacterium sp.]|nr:hypothetical protein [Fervidobacterium sp.]